MVVVVVWWRRSRLGWDIDHDPLNCFPENSHVEVWQHSHSSWPRLDSPPQYPNTGYPLAVTPGQFIYPSGYNCPPHHLPRKGSPPPKTRQPPSQAGSWAPRLPQLGFWCSNPAQTSQLKVPASLPALLVLAVLAVEVQLAGLGYSPRPSEPSGAFVRPGVALGVPGSCPRILDATLE